MTDMVAGNANMQGVRNGKEVVGGSAAEGEKPAQDTDGTWCGEVRRGEALSRRFIPQPFHAVGGDEAAVVQRVKYMILAHAFAFMLMPVYTKSAPSRAL